MNQIALISNIMLEAYWDLCVADCFPLSKNEVHTSSISFEEVFGNAEELSKANLVVVCLNLDALYPNMVNDLDAEKVKIDDLERDVISKCKQLYSIIRTNTNAKIIWFGIEDYCFPQDNLFGTIPVFGGMVDRINLILAEMLKNDVFVDLKRLIAKAGVSSAYDVKGKYRWNAPYSRLLVAMMAEEVHKQYLVCMGKSKKCLVLDCDGVLWGGILAEDGLEGIQISNSGLGRPFQDFQRFLLDMYYHGVMLAVCSKNDREDVFQVFQEHSGMLLKQEHICCFRCNWKDKPSNIRAISESLNIGLDSMVFIDDSPSEIKEVQAALPEVEAIYYQRNTVYGELSTCFHLRPDINLETVNIRMESYRNAEKREVLRAKAESFDEYIASLKMEIDIHKTTFHELARVSELTQRTNKFTNGVRYTIEQLKALVAQENYELYTVCLSDRFSDLGIVGAIGIREGELDLFSLSCRALGRGVEYKMLQYALSRGVNSVYYLSTSKNEELCASMKLHGLTVFQ